MKKELKQSARIGIFGASGSGKTTLALGLVKNVKRVIYFDPLDDLPVKKSFSSIVSLFDFIMKNYNKGFQVRYTPHFPAMIIELSKLCELIVNIQRQFKDGASNANITLFVDELDLSFPLNQSRVNPSNWFYFLCCRGRHYGVNIVGISQRMSLVDLPFRANLSDLFVFRLADFNDIDNAVKMIGKPYKDKIQSLANYQYVYKMRTGVVVTVTK
ncbi:MAG: hypothetical protein NC218_06740 [Acetobacter sp.]|nr:hypothetical protein [Acetobacter sp.]